MLDCSKKHGSYEVRLRLEDHPPWENQSAPKRTFMTYNDTITGTVDVTVTKQITVKNIQVKLSGTSTSEIVQRVRLANGKRRNEREVLTHEVFYDVVTLFPPQNVKEVSTQDKFTLTKGEYHYDFKIQLPFKAHCGDPASKKSSNMYSSVLESNWRKEGDEHRQRSQSHLNQPLPPSFFCIDEDGSADVKYGIKVSVHRAELLSRSSRFERTLFFRPPGPLSSVLGTIPAVKLISRAITLKIPISRKSQSVASTSSWSTLLSAADTIPLKMRLELTTPLTLIPTSDMKFKLKAHFDIEPYNKSSPILFVKSLDLHIVHSAYLETTRLAKEITDFTTLLRTTDTRLLDLSLCTAYTKSSEFKSQLDLTHLLGQNCFDLSKLTPTFRSCNIKFGHALQLNLKVNTTPDSWFKTPPQLSISRSIVITGVPISEEDRIRIYGDYTMAPPPEIDYEPFNMQDMADVLPVPSTGGVDQLPTYSQANGAHSMVSSSVNARRGSSPAGYAFATFAMAPPSFS